MYTVTVTNFWKRCNIADFRAKFRSKCLNREIKSVHKFFLQEHCKANIFDIKYATLSIGLCPVYNFEKKKTRIWTEKKLDRNILEVFLAVLSALSALQFVIFPCIYNPYSSMDNYLKFVNMIQTDIFYCSYTHSISLIKFYKLKKNGLNMTAIYKC